MPKIKCVKTTLTNDDIGLIQDLLDYGKSQATKLGATVGQVNSAKKKLDMLFVQIEGVEENAKKGYRYPGRCIYSKK